jgi:hypothetical protein
MATIPHRERIIPKRTGGPWIVEMQPPNMRGWIAQGAYPTWEDAQVQADNLRKAMSRTLTGATNVRVRNVAEKNGL